MKKQAVILTGSIFLAAGILTGCARTPEESLVKMKGKEAEKNYEEADKKGDSDGEGLRNRSFQLSAPFFSGRALCQRYECHVAERSGSMQQNQTGAAASGAHPQRSGFLQSSPGIFYAT